MADFSPNGLPFYTDNLEILVSVAFSAVLTVETFSTRKFARMARVARIAYGYQHPDRG